MERLKNLIYLSRNQSRNHYTVPVYKQGSYHLSSGRGAVCLWQPVLFPPLAFEKNLVPPVERKPSPPLRPWKNFGTPFGPLKKLVPPWSPQKILVAPQTDAPTPGKKNDISIIKLDQLFFLNNSANIHPRAMKHYFYLFDLLSALTYLDFGWKSLLETLHLNIKFKY